MKDYTSINFNTGIEKKIFDALLELMETRTLSEISTTDILKLANISRSTFYRHYLDKFDVLTKSYDLIVDHSMNKCKGSMVNGYLDLFSIYKQYAIIFSHAFVKDEQNCLTCYIADKMYSRLATMLTDHGMNMNDTYNQYMLSGFIYGTLQIIFNWVNDGAEVESEKIMELVGKMMPREMGDIILMYYA